MSSDGRIRVLRLIDRLNVGGPAQHVVWLEAGLDVRAFASVLVTGTVGAGEGDMSWVARAHGVDPVVVAAMRREPGVRDLVVLARVLRMLWRLRPHVLHTHKSKAGMVGRVAVLLYRWLTPSALWLRPRTCRVVHTYHGHTFHGYFGPARTRLYLAIERALARLCTDRIVVLSEQQRCEIHERYRVGRPEQFRVVRLGIEVGEPVGRSGAFRRELGVGENEELVGMIGRLCGVKNHAMLLEAAARLMGEGRQCRIVVVGDGELRPALEARARALGLAGRVLFTGFRRDVLSLYEDLDLVVLTSINEGTPLTLIEAISRGRAVAATEVGGVVDLLGARHATTAGVTEWDHGVSAPSGDAAAFARAMGYLLDRPALRREMGARGRAFVDACLGRERLVRDVEALYRELVGRPGGAPAQPGVECAPA